MRFYFRLKAYFLFNCHSIEWSCVSKAENTGSWSQFTPQWAWTPRILYSVLGRVPTGWFRPSFTSNESLHLLTSTAQGVLKNRFPKQKKKRNKKNRNNFIFQFLINSSFMGKKLILNLYMWWRCSVVTSKTRKPHFLGLLSTQTHQPHHTLSVTWESHAWPRGIFNSHESL